MNIGYTFDEKYLNKVSIDNWIENSASLGVNSLELAVDEDILPIDTYINIAQKAKICKINLNYHIPYFSSKYYEISSLKEESFSLKYKHLFNSLEVLEKIKLNQKSHLVVHCESFPNIKLRSYEKTIDFIKFLISEIENRKLNLVISLETLGLDDSYKIGSNRSELLHILNTLKDDRVGICYDICHDAMNFFPNQVPLDIDFFKHINYCHIHGYNLKSGKKHISLKDNSLNFLYILDFIELNFPNLTLNLEALYDIEKDNYYKNLIYDITMLNKLYR